MPRYSFMSDAAQGTFHVWDMQERRIVHTGRVSYEVYAELTRLNRENAAKQGTK